MPNQASCGEAGLLTNPPKKNGLLSRVAIDQAVDSKHVHDAYVDLTLSDMLRYEYQTAK